ncbi:hypothetical protein [Streptomyces sp. NPDC020362]|uniref:hypothetical protein n=1 Tax=unclassified Streptomyces TaxID=2593676 RepID=UPI000AAA94AF
MKTVMTSFGKAAVTLVASLGLIVGLSAEAQAAQGEFVYGSSTGQLRTFVNPANNTCYFFEFASDSVINETKTEARVFSSITCSGLISDVAPDKSLQVDGDIINSVMFLP